MRKVFLLQLKATKISIKNSACICCKNSKLHHKEFFKFKKMSKCLSNFLLWTFKLVSHWIWYSSSLAVVEEKVKIIGNLYFFLYLFLLHDLKAAKKLINFSLKCNLCAFYPFVVLTPWFYPSYKRSHKNAIYQASQKASFIPFYDAIIFPINDLGGVITCAYTSAFFLLSRHDYFMLSCISTL